MVECNGSCFQCNGKPHRLTVVFLWGWHAGNEHEKSRGGGEIPITPTRIVLGIQHAQGMREWPMAGYAIKLRGERRVAPKNDIGRGR